MANPNPEIWGTPDTWINAPYCGGLHNTQTELLKFTNPKIANFGDDTGTIYQGVQAGKITANVPLDLTICPCGQDEKVSAFGKLAVLNESGNGSLVPRIVERESPCNWVMYDLKISDSTTDIEQFMIHRAYNYSTYRGMKVDQFSPNASVSNYSNNNYRINPYTFWYLRSLVLQIQVKTFTSPAVSGTGGTWRTLDDWKNNHSTEHICGLRFITMPVNSLNTTTMVLDYYATTPNQFYNAGLVGILDIIPDINNNGTLTDTTFYCFMRSNAQRQRGGVLFDETHSAGNTTGLFILPAWDMFDGQTIQRNGNSSYGYYYYYDIPYSDDTYEKIMKMIACFGCYFTPTSKTSFTYDMTDTDLCLPIIDDDGIAHGEYTRGTGNLNNDLYSDDSIRNKDYDPSRPPTPIDPNTYSDTTNWNTVNFQNTFCKRYELTAAQVGQLAAELWAAQASKPADIDYHNFAIDEYLTNNPIDTIVSLKYFPCDVETAANPAIVHLGKYQTQIAANAISHTVKVIDFDPIDVFPHFGDYRDYEPYTTLQMYIPFCGTVSIPTAEAMGKYVSVKLCIDINTGACVGFVIVSNSGSGGICVATATGTASIDIPVSGLQSANLSQAIFNATAQWTQTQISNAKISSGLLSHAGGLLGNISKGLSKQGGLSPTSLLGALKGGPIGSIGLLDRLDPVKAYWSGYESEIESSKADYNLTHVEIPMRLIGSTSPALSSVIESSCRLIIYRPITDEGALSHYADTVGFATVSSGTVSQFTGYTEGTIDVSGINASASEKSEIQRLFASGVYL